jgi:arylsulfatase A-like enzyme
MVRRALDRDADGASSQWLGGTDCAEGDPARGPHRREQPGDGIDQDCRGADAAPLTTLPISPHFKTKTCIIPDTYRSVLVITIDALRADAPSVKIMPNLVGLARSSLIFDRGYSPSTMTGPSLAALFAGHTIADLHPDNVSSDDPLTVHDSLPQRFKAAGYRTAAFNRVALKTTSFAGFDEYNPYPTDVQPRGKGQLLAAGMVNGALAYMERKDSRPFFLWVHFLDTHAPYTFDNHVELTAQQGALSPYERGAQYVDSHLGRMLREMKHLGLLQRTLIVITADHGEETGNRARLGHGPYLFEDVIHVPLVIASPDCKPETIEEPVSLVHLGQTLRELSGTAPADIAPPPQLPVVVEEAPISLLGFKRAVISDQFKLIIDVMNGGRMLFDLSTDPAEIKDLYGQRPDLAAHMEALYQNWLDHPGDR